MDERNQEADVVIVGDGIMGMSETLSHSRDGLRTYGCASVLQTLPGCITGTRMRSEEVACVNDTLDRSAGSH